MYLGIDVGGTHTDAVVVEKDLSVVAAAKATTVEPVAESLREVLRELAKSVNLADSIKRLTISTTLGLNRVLTGKSDPVGIIVTSGPGLDLEPAEGAYGGLFKQVTGSQDHRGQVLAPINPKEVELAVKDFASKGAKALVLASKFGPKNPELEESLGKVASDNFKGPIMHASNLFGGLNFRRRLNSAYLNASIHSVYEAFFKDLSDVVSEFKLSAQVFILKSDGGVMSLEDAARLPVLALSAGPAASLLGLWHLYQEDESDILMVDMGGTSTDLSVIRAKQPLLSPEGLNIAGYNTLVRGLLTKSIALGGDTDLLYQNCAFNPEPIRRGPALSLDPENAPNRAPTLTDATNVLGLSSLGNVEISKEAYSKLDSMATDRIAEMALQAVMERLKASAQEFIDDINQKPVYTISELLVETEFIPKKVVFLGGPAQSIKEAGAKILGIPGEAPPEASYANALGAALAKPTQEAELYADTALGILTIPTLGIKEKISNSSKLDDVTRIILKAFDKSLNMQITLQESFNQVNDYGYPGRIMRVRVQSAPGLITPE